MDAGLEVLASPKIRIELYGMFGEREKPQFFDAIIDTGFTGGISMPVAQALPLGLVLFSVATFVLADGSKEQAFLCLGSAKIDGREKSITFSLSQGGEILLGTEFLEAFNSKLCLDYKTKQFTLEAQDV
ncbi:MAG: hypothetical protein PHS79_01605 [Patescibacteria group bacterium]|nr:hypothetical protein [Patescibacteria group bacterium]